MNVRRKKRKIKHIEEIVLVASMVIVIYLVFYAKQSFDNIHGNKWEPLNNVNGKQTQEGTETAHANYCGIAVLRDIEKYRNTKIQKAAEDPIKQSKNTEETTETELAILIGDVQKTIIEEETTATEEKEEILTENTEIQNTEITLEIISIHDIKEEKEPEKDTNKNIGFTIIIREPTDKEEYKPSMEKKVESGNYTYECISTDGIIEKSFFDSVCRYYKMVPQVVRDHFMGCEWSITITTASIANAYPQYNWTSVKAATFWNENRILLETRSGCDKALLHEFGHYIYRFTSVAGFTEIYQLEVDSFANTYYPNSANISSESEYFAECFEKYMLNVEKLKNCVPNTVSYIEECIQQF